MHKNTSTGRVESRTVRACIRVEESTTAIVCRKSLATVVNEVACCVDAGAISGKVTSSSGMECILVGRLVVDTFKDIDLAPLGPVRADRPVCRPHATTVRHEFKVGNEKTTVPGLF